MKTKGIIFMTGVFMLLSTSLAFAQKTVITQTQLPKNAQSFITSYFPDQTINYIIQDKETFSVDYDVHFNGGMEIEFDSNGDWKEVDGEYQAIPTGFISPKIMEYVNKQYPNVKVIKAEKGRYKQEVKLSNGFELEFSLSGDFLRIDD